MTRRPNVETRRRILEAARRLFAEGGYAGVSMDRVAAASGVKKANLFHYYPSKEALGTAVVEEAAARHAESAGGPFADPGRDPLSAVDALFAAAAEACSSKPKGCFIGRMAQEAEACAPGMRRRLRACLGEWRDGLAAFLEGWRRKGWFKRDFDSRAAADGILALYEGSLLLAKARGGAEPVRNAGLTARTALGAWRA